MNKDVLEDFRMYGIYRKEINELAAEIMNLRKLSGDLGKAADFSEVISLLNDRLDKYKECIAHINGILDSLKNPVQREIMFLRYGKLLTVDQIADLMGYCNGSVYYHLKNAKKRLEELQE